MNIYFLIWCFLLVASILFELLSPGLFFFLSFALGCAAGAISNYFSLSLDFQLQAFALVTLVSFFLLKLLSKKLSGHLYSTNVDALIGKKGMVTDKIQANGMGYIKINGEVWLAKSHENYEIDTGSVIEVVGFKGSHLIVKKVG